MQPFTLVQTRFTVLSPRLADRRQDDAIITLGEATTKLLLARGILSVSWANQCERRSEL